jgi:hypothetical protein
MLSGMPPFTLFHVLISLIGILSGFIAVFGMIAAKRLDGWTAVFLLTTALTSITGFFFPFHKLLPSHILGVVSLIVLAIAIPARYVRNLEGPWRKTYAITASIALSFPACLGAHTIGAALPGYSGRGDDRVHRAGRGRRDQVPP